MNVAMSMVRVLIFMSVPVLLFLTESVSAGLIMEQVRYEKGDAEKQKGMIYVSKNKIKFTDGEGQTLAILNLETGEMIQVDNDGKRYTIASPEDYFRFIQDTTAKMKSEIEKQLAQLPPDQRAQMEQAMKSQGLTMPGETKPKKLTLKKTDATETIAGYNSNKYEVYEDGKLSEEIWISREVGFDKELDMKKMADYMTQIKKMSETSGVGYSNLDEEEKNFKEIYESGFPTKSVDYRYPNSVIIEEITKVTKADIADGEFQAPNGYKKITLQEMMASEIPSR